LPTSTDTSRILTVLVSNAQDGDLSVLRLDTATGTLSPAARCPVGEAVMPLNVAAGTRMLYAATRGAEPALVSFAVAQDGGLSRQSDAAIGTSMAYIATDRARRYLFGASYGGDSLTVYRLARLEAGDPTPLQTFEGIRHAHAAVVSPDDRFVYVSSLGSDRIVCLRIDDASPEAPLVPVGDVTLDAGFGPRHLRFSPAGDRLYVLSEFRATIAILRRDPDSGQLTPEGVSARAPVLAALADGRVRTAANTSSDEDKAALASMIWAADIHVRPDGRYVYVTERTTSRLIAYRVESGGARLEPAGHIDTEAQPRGFAIDPSGSILVACGERSQQVAAYRIDAASGELTLLSRCEGGRGANWIEIIDPVAA
jgi:6-phosphogluconolactonase